MENNVNWKQEHMFEVLLKEPDDFLKIEKHYLVSELLHEKKESYINLATYFINKEDIISFTLKNYLHLMVKIPTCQRMILQEEIQ